MILLYTLLFVPELHSANLNEKNKINLLVIHSFDSALPDYLSINKIISKNLDKKDIRVSTQYFYLDCDAFDRDGELQRITHLLDTISVRPDMILVTEDQATYSLLASRHPLLKTLPIVFSGLNFPNWELLKEYPNVTGIWDRPNYEKNVQMIEKLMGVKRIRFFYDKTYNGKRAIGRLAEQYKNKDPELYQSLIHFLHYKDSIKNEDDPADSTKQGEKFNTYLKGNDNGECPANTCFYFVNMRDELGASLLWQIYGTFRHSVFLITKYDYTIAKVGRLATIPTFSAINRGFAQNQDILGGYFTPIESQLEETCDYISKIVKGESITRLPIKESQKKYLLDWTVLTRWNIPVEDVPSGFEIVNMPFYVKYRMEAIVITAIITLFILSLITYLYFLYSREAKRKRRAQSDLREEKEFLSLALEGGKIFAWRYNRDTSEFIFDKEFSDSVGIDSVKISLKELSQMIHPDELEHILSTFISVVNLIHDHADLRLRINFNGSGYVWYEFRFLNISGILKDKSSVIGLVMNIQDYKNKEEELVIARDLALKAELKQSFLANMSHEIRTPLNAIVGFSNILVADDSLPEEDKQEYIRIININCELLLKLINDILEISRIESGNMSFEFETCNLNDLVEDIYKMCVLQTPPNVEFKTLTPVDSLCIDTDAMRVKQVIMNFVNNAFKFTSSGHVTIGIENDKSTKEVCIYVEDTGEGIPEEQQKMIFDRFYKVDEFAQGTGLGLSICQVIAERLKGRITLFSEVGKGSRFEIVLPYTDKPSEKQDINDRTEHLLIETDNSTGDNLPVVLIAEDSVNNYMVLNNILKKSATVIWTINGKDALEVIEKRKVDLVLMDIKMGEMDGITALKKIRKKHKNLPVIIQTAYAYEENQKQAKLAGASGFIAKPVKPGELLSVVNKFVKIEGTKE